MASQYETRFTSDYKAQSLELERKQSRQRAWMAYIVPLVMLAIGFTIGAGWPALTALNEEGPHVAALVLAVYAVILSISVVVGLVALIITCKLFGSGAGQLWLGLVRLAGIFSLMLIAAAVVAPLLCWGWLILIALMAGLIAWQFEMEIAEGVAASVVCGFIFIGTIIVISMILSRSL